MRAVHCTACGARLEPYDDHGVPRRRCPACARIHYENSKPAVGAVALREGSVLLSRRARAPGKGLWDLPGGFLEAGEDPEAGLLREIREETGCAATVLGLLHVAVGEYGGEPTLNLVYEMRLDGEPSARDDSETLAWFPLGSLPDLAFPHERDALERARNRTRIS